MKPIFFPFTFIDDTVAAKLNAVLGPLVIYQPAPGGLPGGMQPWVADGRIEPRVPVASDAQRLHRLVKDYRQWAAVHQGAETSVYKVLRDAIPFFDESSATQIRSNLKQLRQEAPPAAAPQATEDTRLFSARVFLQMAQEFDLQTWEMQQTLRAQAGMNRDLMQLLHGQADDVSAPGIMNAAADPAENSEDYMLDQRLASWASLMQHDPEAQGPFVTHVRAVMDFLLEQAPEARVLPWPPAAVAAAKDYDPGAARHLLEALRQIAVEPWKDGAQDSAPVSPAILNADTADLKLYIVPDIAPQRFFARFGVNADVGPHAATQTAEMRHTLLACVTV